MTGATRTGIFTVWKKYEEGSAGGRRGEEKGGETVCFVPEIHVILACSGFHQCRQRHNLATAQPICNTSHQAENRNLSKIGSTRRERLGP